MVLSSDVVNDRIATPMKGHPGYFGNSTEITAEVVRQVNSPNLGLVFDFYHMQIMGEDLMDMVRRHGDLIRYVHVAGAYPVSDKPDAIQRAELHHKGQLVDYPAVMAALKKEKGFDGPVALEYIPTATDSQAAEDHLRQAMQLCGL